MKPDFGLDAPGLIGAFFAIGVGGAIATAAGAVFLGGDEGLGRIAIGLGGLVAAYGLGMGCFMIYGSKVMKPQDADQSLDRLTWTGGERVLDIGCGRGLMLIGAARRLDTGRAVGVDLWRASDQSANTGAAAIGNARLAGVAERVAIVTADMRALPMAEETFDVVVSNWAVHNLATRGDRQRALSEMARVLRPGGRLLLIDIANRAEYRSDLPTAGFEDVTLVINRVRDRILALISLGNFRPVAFFARRARG